MSGLDLSRIPDFSAPAPVRAPLAPPALDLVAIRALDRLHGDIDALRDGSGPRDRAVDAVLELIAGQLAEYGGAVREAA